MIDAVFLPHEADLIKSIPLSIQLLEDKLVWAANSNEKKRQKICDVNMINYLKNLNEIMIITKGKEMNIIILPKNRDKTDFLKKIFKCFSKSFSMLRKLLK